MRRSRKAVKGCLVRRDDVAGAPGVAGAPDLVWVVAVGSCIGEASTKAVADYGSSVGGEPCDPGFSQTTVLFALATASPLPTRTRTSTWLPKA